MNCYLDFLWHQKLVKLLDMKNNFYVNILLEMVVVAVLDLHVLLHLIEHLDKPRIIKSRISK
jgi:hypothetical protein